MMQRPSANLPDPTVERGYAGTVSVWDSLGRLLELQYWRGRLLGIGMPQAAATMTVGAESANVIAVTVRLPGPWWVCHAWLTDAPRGAFTAAAPSGGWAAGVGTLLAQFTANKHGLWQANQQGLLRVDVTEAGAATWYLQISSHGPEYVSPAITFA